MNSTNVRLGIAGLMALAGIAMIVFGTVQQRPDVQVEGVSMLAGSGLTAWAESNVAADPAPPPG